MKQLLIGVAIGIFLAGGVVSLFAVFNKSIMSVDTPRMSKGEVTDFVMSYIRKMPEVKSCYASYASGPLPDLQSAPRGTKGFACSPTNAEPRYLGKGQWFVQLTYPPGFVLWLGAPAGPFLFNEDTGKVVAP